MTIIKARIISVALLLILYISLLYPIILSGQFALVRSHFFISSITAAVTALIIMFFDSKSSKGIQFSTLRLWGIILLPLILGVIAFSGIYQGNDYSEIDWIFYPMALCIALNAWGLLFEGQHTE